MAKIYCRLLSCLPQFVCHQEAKDHRGFAAMMYMAVDTYLSHYNVCPHYSPEIFSRTRRFLLAVTLLV